MRFYQRHDPAGGNATVYYILWHSEEGISGVGQASYETEFLFHVKKNDKKFVLKRNLKRLTFCADFTSIREF